MHPTMHGSLNGAKHKCKNPCARWFPLHSHTPGGHCEQKQLALPDEFVLDLDLRHTELVEALAPPFKRFGGPSQVTVSDATRLRASARRGATCTCSTAMLGYS